MRVQKRLDLVGLRWVVHCVHELVIVSVGCVHVVPLSYRLNLGESPPPLSSACAFPFGKDHISQELTSFEKIIIKTT